MVLVKHFATELDKILNFSRGSNPVFVDVLVALVPVFGAEAPAIIITNVVGQL